jgi:hypothetical protein
MGKIGWGKENDATDPAKKTDYVGNHEMPYRKPCYRMVVIDDPFYHIAIPLYSPQCNLGEFFGSL